MNARGGIDKRLHIHADYGCLNHARHPDRLGHERKPAARCRRTSTRQPAMRRADDHIHDADFVLELANHDAQLPRSVAAFHAHQHAGGRGLRGIRRVKLYARRDAAHRRRHVASQNALAEIRHFERERLERCRVTDIQRAKPTFSAMTASPLRLNIRVSAFSSLLNLSPSICSVAAMATVFPASQKRLQSCFSGNGQSCTPGSGRPGLDFVSVKEE